MRLAFVVAFSNAWHHHRLNVTITTYFMILLRNGYKFMFPSYLVTLYLWCVLFSPYCTANGGLRL
jgi:hypothetical protein